ncbi:DMT family transporter [Candidatus Woesearchaeota archaeon]|nr:DMT family transporter [Candidatus Woesearchaeota archaeon]
MNNKGLMLVFLTALISGFSIFINAFGVKGFDSSVFTFSKNIVVALFLFSILMFFNKFNELRKLSLKQWKQLMFIGLIGGSIPFLLFFKGLQMTTGTSSAFIHKTLFIYASVFALLFLKEKLNKGFILGAGLLLIGNYLMLKPSFEFSFWHVLVLVATIFWAAENAISKNALKELSGTIVAFGRMFFGSLFILVFLISTGKFSSIFSMSIEQYGWILITSVFLLGYVLTYYNGLKRVKLSVAAPVLALGSPITTLLNLVYKGIALSLNQSLGILLIIAGIMSIVWFVKVSELLKYMFKVGQHGRS